MGGGADGVEVKRGEETGVVVVEVVIVVVVVVVAEE